MRGSRRTAKVGGVERNLKGASSDSGGGAEPKVELRMASEVPGTGTEYRVLLQGGPSTFPGPFWGLPRGGVQKGCVEGVRASGTFRLAQCRPISGRPGAHSVSGDLKDLDALGSLQLTVFNCRPHYLR